MSGPIVRTGTTPEFWANWDKAFGDKKKTKKKTATKSSKKTAKQTGGKSKKAKVRKAKKK